MTEAHLTLGAHMLLWGFPLAITVLAIVTAIRGRDQSGGSP
jgi:cytochrome c-type biogenesis protein CcmH/NrfF